MCQKKSKSWLTDSLVLFQEKEPSATLSIGSWRRILNNKVEMCYLKSYLIYISCFQDVRQNKLTKLRRHASRVHFAKIQCGRSSISQRWGADLRRGEYFSVSRDRCPCLIFLFSCSSIQIRCFVQKYWSGTVTRNTDMWIQWYVLE